MAQGKLKQKVHYMSRLTEENIHELEDHADDTVVILGMHEFVWSNKSDVDAKRFYIEYLEPYIAKYADLPEEDKPDVKFLVSGYKYPTQDHAKIHGDVVDGQKEYGIPWAELVYWPTFYLGEGIHDFYPKATMCEGHRLTQAPGKLFTLFQNRGTRPHRVSLMHSVHQEGLNDHGVIRYCNSGQAWEQFLDQIENEEHKIGVHQPHKALFDKMLPNMHKYFSPAKWWPPGESSFDTSYFDGLIDLVSTTTLSHIIYCEKTLRPLYTGKPFLLFGAPNCNNHLKDFGFELYDEIFDYADDNNFTDEVYGFPLHTMKIRRRSYYYDQMLKPLFEMDKSPSAIRDLFNRTREKAKHNQKALVDLIFDNDRIPYVFDQHMPNLNCYFSSIIHARYRLSTDDYFKQFLTATQVAEANLSIELAKEMVE